MEITALLLSRLQFAFTVSFHIIFPSFTIGLAAWLTVLEALHLASGQPTYRVVFEFWLKIFGVAFGMGVVSGIVMAFQFGTNWSVLSKMSGPIQGVLLSYETFTAFFLEASFFGILLFGRTRVAPWFYLFSTGMVALGTTLSAFWILVNNSRLCAGPWRCCSHRLGHDPGKSGALGSISPYAARCLHDGSLLRRGDRRLVLAPKAILRRGAHHAAHGPWPRRRACAGPARHRPFQR
jgi:hypothetical protein